MTTKPQIGGNIYNDELEQAARSCQSYPEIAE